MTASTGQGAVVAAVREVAQREIGRRRLTRQFGQRQLTERIGDVVHVKSRTGEDEGIIVIDDNEVSQALDFLDYEVSTCGLKVAQCDSMRKAVDDLRGFEFITWSPTGLANLSKYHVMLKRYADTLGSRAVRAGELRDQLVAAKERRDDKERNKRLKGFLVEVKKFKKAAEDAADELTEAVDEFQDVIEEAALYNYMKTHPDGARKTLEQVEKVANVATSVGGKFAGAAAGFGWLAGTITLVKTITLRAVSEGLIATQKSKYGEEHFKGEIFDAFSEDPSIMAAGLTATLKQNIDIVVDAIGVAGDNIPFWDDIAAVAKGVVYTYLDERVNRAKALWTVVNEPDPATRAAKAKAAYRAQFENLGTQLESALKARLLEGDVLSNSADALKKMADHAANSELVKADITSGVGLAAFIVPVIMKRILKAFPPDPAQLVTGDELQNAITGLAIAAIPDEYFVKVPPTQAKPGETRPTVPADALPKERHGYRIVDSDNRPGVTKTDPNGDPMYYVAINCCGVKVWGYINKHGEWTPEYIDPSAFDSAKWANRRITRRGYKENGKEIRGVWAKPFKTSQFVLFRDDGNIECARGIDTTLSGRGYRNTVEAFVASIARTNVELVGDQ